jgi:hypothetical protein
VTVTQTKPFRAVAPDGGLDIHFHPGQWRTWQSTARIVAMLAGSQGGKTVLGPHWMHREIERCGEGDYLVGTATFPLLNLKLLSEYRLVFCELLRWGKYSERNGTHLIESNDKKSRIIFFSATNPESIESATAKAAHLDEAGQKQFRQDTWQAVNRRLAIHQGRILITTTLYTLGWLKTDVYDRWKAGDRDIEVIQFDSIANPAYPMAEYERARSTLPPWKFAMFNRGRYETPAGLVHDSFGAADIIDRFPIPKDWLVYVGHDFGIANPAALFTAQNPATGELFYWHEYLPGSGRSVHDHVEAWAKITSGYNVIARVGGNHAEQETRDAYTAHGWHIIEPRQRSVAEQVLRVIGQERLHKIKVFRDLSGIIEEKQTFSYELDDKYQPTDKYEDEASMHLLAAERYLHTYFTPETAVKRPSYQSSWGR